MKICGHPADFTTADATQAVDREECGSDQA